MTYRGKRREPAIALLTPECRWPKRQERGKLSGMRVSRLLIQAFPTLASRGRDTEQGHDCCVQGSRADELEETSGSPIRVNADIKSLCQLFTPSAFAPPAPLKRQESTMVLVTGRTHRRTSQLPNPANNRTTPQQNSVKILLSSYSIKGLWTQGKEGKDFRHPPATY